MKKRYFVLLALCVTVTGLFGLLLAQFGFSLPTNSSANIRTDKPVFILDAGHGGEDGGALSITGTKESEINLAIVRKMDDIFGLYGSKAITLRSEDISLHDPGAVTLREKKVSDLKNRTEAVNSQPNGVLISIHQNSYPGEQYWGMQTFYAATDGSQLLAESLQSAVQSALQTENQRQAKVIPDNVYLMNHVRCPAVLVECGFLTNRKEESRLREDAYQRKLAAVLTTAAIRWRRSDGVFSGTVYN